MTLKIAHLGRQMRDTKEIFSALKDNVDQIMANLQDGLMLFTRDSRVVLVSASVAVSYTHLDVYKRQAANCVTQVLWGY